MATIYLYTSFREKIADIDARLSMLQNAEDNYYMTAKYMLELTKLSRISRISNERNQQNFKAISIKSIAGEL